MREGCCILFNSDRAVDTREAHSPKEGSCCRSPLFFIVLKQKSAENLLLANSYSTILARVANCMIGGMSYRQTKCANQRNYTLSKNRSRQTRIGTSRCRGSCRYSQSLYWKAELPFWAKSTITWCHYRKRVQPKQEYVDFLSSYICCLD